MCSNVVHAFLGGSVMFMFMGGGYIQQIDNINLYYFSWQLMGVKPGSLGHLSGGRRSPGVCPLTQSGS